MAIAMLLSVVCVFATLSGVAYKVYASIMATLEAERAEKKKIQKEKHEVIEAKKKILSLAKVHQKGKDDIEMVKYLESANRDLEGVAGKLEFTQTRNRELKHAVHHVREIQMENSTLDKDAKKAEALEKRNSLLKQKVARIAALTVENEELAAQIETIDDVKRENKKLNEEVEALNVVKSENADLQTSLQILQGIEQENIRLGKEQTRVILHLVKENAALSKENGNIAELEKKKAALSDHALKVRNLLKENELLESEGARLKSVAAKNAALRGAADKVYTLETENDELEEVVDRLEAAEDLNADLKDDAVTDRLIALDVENARLQRQAALCAKLASENSLLAAQAQEIERLQKEADGFKEMAVSLDEVLAYHLSLKECVDAVRKLEASNKELEKTAKKLPALQAKQSKLTEQIENASKETSSEKPGKVAVIDKVKDFSVAARENLALKESNQYLWRIEAENKLLRHQALKMEKIQKENVALKEQVNGAHRLEAEMRLLQGQVMAVEKMKEEKAEMEKQLNWLHGDDLVPLQKENRGMKHEANALRRYKSENDSLTAQVQNLEEEAAKNAKLKARLAEMHRLQAENSKLEQNEKDALATKPPAIQTRINTRKPSNENIHLASNVEIDLLTSSISHSKSLSVEDLPKSFSGALDIEGVMGKANKRFIK